MMRFSVGIVGAGAITRNSHLPVLRAMPNVHVAWLADSNRERAHTLAGAHGVTAVHATSPAALPDCDVVLLAIPVGARSAYYDSLAERQIAVFVEKPFAVNQAEHRRVLGLYEPDRIGCAFMRRFYRATQIVRDVISRGWLGPLLSMRIADGGRWMRTGSDRSFIDDLRLSSGGVLADYGCHAIDTVLRVSAATRFDVERAEFAIDGGIDREASALVRLHGSQYLAEEGATLDLCTSWLAPPESKGQFRFQRATIWFEFGPDSQVWLGDPARPREALSLMGEVSAATTYNQAFFLEWKEFLDGVEHRRESSVSARSALLTTQLVDQIYEKGGLPRG